MDQVHYLTDQDGNPQAVVVPIELWRRVLPRETDRLDELTEAFEDYCLGRAMDEGQQSELLSRDEALKFLED